MADKKEPHIIVKDMTLAYGSNVVQHNVSFTVNHWDVFIIMGGSVALGARCCADNANYWLTRCELTEKIKLRFDHEGIPMALPRRQVYLQPSHGDEAG